MDNSSLCIHFTDFNKLIMMFPDEINQIPKVHMVLSCFYRTEHKFSIFWKQFSLALKDEQIKKSSCQQEFPLAMASGRVEFSSPAHSPEATFELCLTVSHTCNTSLVAPLAVSVQVGCSAFLFYTQTKPLTRFHIKYKTLLLPLKIYIFIF